MSLSYKLILPIGVEHPSLTAPLVCEFEQCNEDFFKGEIDYYIRNSAKPPSERKSQDFRETGEWRNVCRFGSRRYSEFCGENFAEYINSKSLESNCVVVNTRLVELANKMDAWTINLEMLEKHRIDEGEFQQFRRMIRAYADLGAVLDSV